MGWAEAAAFEAGHLQACSSPPPAQGTKSSAATACCAFAFPYLGDALVGCLGAISHLDGAAGWGTAPEGWWVPPCQTAGYLFTFSGYRCYPLPGLPLPSCSSEVQL